MSFASLLKRFFGEDAFDWVDRSYLTDWTLVALIWLFSWLSSQMSVFERDFSPHDSVIGHPHKKNQIGSVLNHSIALYIPIFCVVVAGLMRRSLVGIHHGTIAVCAGRGLARLITEFLKHKIGRLRPDFLARCKWDKGLKACTGNANTILDGRKSFPSGHSSTAFAGMMFLSLWIAGQTAAWCFHVPKRAASLKSTRMAILVATFIPLLWATFVAVSRIEDYRHHKEDVIIGSLIGVVSSTICYLLFWPNPFSARNFTNHYWGQPRMLYENTNIDERFTNDAYELGDLEDDERNAV